jgi:hypothetical protein
MRRMIGEVRFPGFGVHHPSRTTNLGVVPNARALDIRRRDDRDLTWLTCDDARSRIELNDGRPLPLSGSAHVRNRDLPHVVVFSR